MKKVIRRQPDRKVKRKRKNMEEPTDVKIPIETWMRSQDISGFPTLALAILGPPLPSHQPKYAPAATSYSISTNV